MREILFRGKCVGAKEWVYGYFFAKPILEKYFIELGNEMWQVDPDTVGEYTGLQDKNGKKIFEGDIVKIDDDSTYKFEVKFGKCSRTKFQDEGHIGIYFDCINVKYIRNDPLFWATRKHGIKIIGNIHDNPELLEVK